MTNVVAVIAAHADDEVLGCGGTMARLADEGYDVHVLLMADGESSRADAADSAMIRDRVSSRQAAAEQARDALRCTSVQTLDLPDNRMDGLELLDVVRHIETFLARFRPQTVFTHHAGDVNIDHRIVHDAVIAACRPQPGFVVTDLLFFEIPSSTEWRPPSSGEPFNPNWFVDISATLERKLEALRSYEPEMRPFPHARSLRAVEALASWRGATVGATAAEAFVLGRRIVR